MIDGYYKHRGLDENGLPKRETSTELGLDLFVQAP
jgi:aldehyde:ferredoxin oxidoreductase